MRLRDAIENYKVSEYWGYPFEELNPIQSTIYDHRRDDANFIISAATSAGKTIVAEILMEMPVRQQERCIFLSPLKAVTAEKYDDWKSEKHRWSKRNISILTGDFALTSDRIDELYNSDIVLMTTEMLLSRCRNIESEKSDWLRNIHTLVIDEAHLITVEGRGDLAEMGVVAFSQLNPNARIVFLSATMDNTNEIAEWLTLLNKKETHILESNYRPAKLFVNFVPYEQINWKEKNSHLFSKICDILEEYPKDKFLVFFHSKKQINEFYEYAHQHDMDIYTADVSKDNRERIIKEFKNKNGSIRIVLSTSALAWGVNLPARRVIIADVRFGFDLVKPYDIKQMIGRAGRIGWDDQGDAYIIAPCDLNNMNFQEIKDYYSQGNFIKSTIDENTFTFHLIADVNLKNIRNYNDIDNILKKTLLYKQGKTLKITGTVDELLKFEAMEVDNGEYSVKPIGMIASWLFFYPQDIYYLRNNLLNFYEKDLSDDIKISYLLGNLYMTDGMMNSEQKKESDLFLKDNRILSRTPQKIFAYYLMLISKFSLPFNAIILNLRNDLERVELVLNLLNKFYSMNKKDLIKKIFLRIKYGISVSMLELAEIKGLGSVRLKKLEGLGICKKSELFNLNALQIKQAFGTEKTYKKILEEIS